MPRHYVFKIGWQIDSNLPRDAIWINPCFRWDDGAPGPDNGNVQTLVDAFDTWFPTAGPVYGKAYDLEGTPPVFPVGTYTKRPAGTPGTSTAPRELALCLSYFGDQNVRRDRGRLYMPAFMLGGSIAMRPSLAQRTKVGDVATILKDFGGSTVDWITWSRVGQKATAAKNWWVDDEWDIQRRRGLRGTTRLTGTTSEA